MVRVLSDVELLGLTLSLTMSLGFSVVPGAVCGDGSLNEAREMEG